MEVVIGKRQLSDLGKRVNDHATRGGITGFAKRFMEKHGWKEGQGLGKNKDGVTEHIKIKQREDNAGLGIEEHERKSVTENWWFGSFEQALSSFKNIGATEDGDKKAKKKRKSKTKETKTEVVASTMWGSAENGIAVPSYEELFKATGGKHLGMRARASQKGKWARTEQTAQVASSADGSTVTTTSTTQEVEDSTGSTASASTSAIASVAATMVESDTSSEEVEVVAVDQAAIGEGKKRKKDRQKKSRRREGREGDGVAGAGGEDDGCGTVALEALGEEGHGGVACVESDGAEMKRDKKKRKKDRKSRGEEMEQEAAAAVHEEDDVGEDNDVKPEKRKSKKKRKRGQESKE